MTAPELYRSLCVSTPLPTALPTSVQLSQQLNRFDVFPDLWKGLSLSHVKILKLPDKGFESVCDVWAVGCDLWSVNCGLVWDVVTD